MPKRPRVLRRVQRVRGVVRDAERVRAHRASPVLHVAEQGLLDHAPVVAPCHAITAAPPRKRDCRRRCHVDGDAEIDLLESLAARMANNYGKLAKVPL